MRFWLISAAFVLFVALAWISVEQEQAYEDEWRALRVREYTAAELELRIADEPDLPIEPATCGESCWGCGQPQQ